ncbi:MAG TPA: TatD family hydrolase, partial [Methylophilaceae bacterium]|nr:TatD family hydrolase [Methylophilaceae bacterium]
MPGLVDTHCHLDAAEFDADRDEVVQAAWDAGVTAIVVPAVERGNFFVVEALCNATPRCLPAYGIHPMYVDGAAQTDLAVLGALLAKGQCVAVGEIGLDFFVEGYDRELQEWFFVEQLKLAHQYDLPVLLHIRRAQDAILKHLRRIKVRGGIAHAFNGSRQQADEFIKLGFKLGFGGAMTWPRALRIRELAAMLPLEAIVLETDAPDMPPEWLGSGGRNNPQQLPHIAQTLAELRRVNVGEIIDA